MSISERVAMERGEKIGQTVGYQIRLEQVSIAERVAMERGEKIGQTVGYQIRLESR